MVSFLSETYIVTKWRPHSLHLMVNDASAIFIVFFLYSYIFSNLQCFISIVHIFGFWLSFLFSLLFWWREESGKSCSISNLPRKRRICGQYGRNIGGTLLCLDMLLRLYYSKQSCCLAGRSFFLSLSLFLCLSQKIQIRKLTLELKIYIFYRRQSDGKLTSQIYKMIIHNRKA